MISHTATSPTLSPCSSEASTKPAALSPALRQQLLRHMLIARGVDKEALKVQRTGRLDLWLSVQGAEAAQVGAALALHGVVIVPSFREHALALYRGITPVELLSQWAGRTYCGWDVWKHEFFPYTLVVASQCLHAVGYALGSRLQNQDKAVALFVGDGATSEGDFSEALNLAAVESAPVLIFCQNNGWALSKPAAEQMKTSLTERANGFGISSTAIDGRDPEAVYHTTQTALEAIRAGKGPQLIEIRVERILGHATSDAQELYRSEESIQAARTADPLPRYQNRLSNLGLIDDTWLADVAAEITDLRQTMAEAFA